MKLGIDTAPRDFYSRKMLFFERQVCPEEGAEQVESYARRRAK